MSIALYSCNKTKIKRLQILQKRAMLILIILGCGKYSLIDLTLGKLHWLNVSDFVETNALTFIQTELKLKTALNIIKEF